MPSAREVGHQRLGIGEGEALMELQPQRGARRHVGVCADDAGASALPAAGCAASRRAGRRKRRRQLGCSSIVPGRLGCSATPMHVLQRHDASAAPATGRRRPARHRRPDRPAVSVGGVARRRRRRRRRPATARARSCRPLRDLGSGDRAEPAARCDVLAAPPAGDGRQVVRGGHADGVGAPVSTAA